jgi:hypothetical protein
VSKEIHVKNAANYAKQYDGPTEFKAKYKVCLKADKSLDPNKSTIEFTLVYFTWNGKKNDGKKKGKEWETLPIKITGVTLNAAKTEVESFTLKANDWYPNLETDYPPLVNAGLSGAVDFTTKKANWTAKYQNTKNAVITIYVVTGEIK